MEITEKHRYIFGRLFLLANRIQVIGDRVLAGEMTIRQWLLTAAIAQLGETPPTISQVASCVDSSHQNVKQLAVKLCEKGFLVLEKDEMDSRATRLRLTGKTKEFWENSSCEIKSFLVDIFSNFSDNEINSLYQCFNKLYKSIKSK